MFAFFWIVVVFLSLMIAIKTLGESSVYLQRWYFVGINLWAQWLPILATGVYVFLVGSSVSDQSRIIKSSELVLNGYFSLPELIILFLLTPLFFTKMGNLFGAAVTAYLVERLYLSSSNLSVNSGVLLLVSCTTIITILSDKMPWLTRQSYRPLAARWREILLILLAMFALLVIITTIFDARQFSVWVSHYCGLNLSTAGATIALLGLSVGWMTIVLGITRHFSLPILCLPSLLITAYTTHWPSYVLVVPFAASLALALAVTDRRMLA